MEVLSKENKNLVLKFYPDYEEENVLFEEIKNTAETLGMLVFVSAPFISLNKPNNPQYIHMVLCRNDKSHPHAKEEFLRFIELKKSEHKDITTSVFYFYKNAIELECIFSWLEQNNVNYDYSELPAVDPESFETIDISRFKLFDIDNCLKFKLTWWSAGQ